MATKNDITNDTLITKASSQSYRDNYDAIFKKVKDVIPQEDISSEMEQSLSNNLTKLYEE